jgi:hypothetical protein
MHGKEITEDDISIDTSEIAMRSAGVPDLCIYVSAFSLRIVLVCRLCEIALHNLLQEFQRVDEISV